jgi:predicted AAA+ superfamily ATPase
LAISRSKAIAEAQKKAAEWKSQQQLQFEEAVQNRAKAWEEVNTTLKEKLPRAFAPDPEDEVDKQAFTKGYALADLLFMGEDGVAPEQIEALPAAFKESVKSGKKLTEIQKTQLHALARIKMANHDRQTIKLKQASDRIKELETELEQYRKSEPDAGKAGEAGDKVIAKDWEQSVADELKAMDK